MGKRREADGSLKPMGWKNGKNCVVVGVDHGWFQMWPTEEKVRVELLEYTVNII